MWMAFLQHSPEDTAYGFGDSAEIAAETLVLAYPGAGGRELDVVEVFPGKGFSTAEETLTEKIIVGARKAPVNARNVPRCTLPQPEGQGFPRKLVSVTLCTVMNACSTVAVKPRLPATKMAMAKMSATLLRRRGLDTTIIDKGITC